jgi:predicted Zn-dependent protease
MITRTLFLLLGLSLSGCAQVISVGTKAGLATGLLSSTQVTSLQQASLDTAKTYADISPEQEYYLGRAVSATLLSRYFVSEHPQENRYLNLIGKNLVLNSDKPETYDNYHFLLLDSEEINAFAAPSGFIFVTKGMLRLCQNEDDVAAVLAHEVSHTLHSHALKVINASRITSALTLIGTDSANSQTQAQLLPLFEGSVNDITQTLVNSGYGKDVESEADKTAVTLLQASGYNADSLIRVLEQLKINTRSNVADFTSTHPNSDDRIAQVRDWVKNATVNPVSAVRTRRFYNILGRL